MMIPSGVWVSEQINLFLAWLQTYVLVWDTVIQCAAMIGLLVVAHFFAGRSAAWLDNKLENHRPRSIIRMHVSYQESLFLVYAIGLLWFAVMVAPMAGVSYEFLRMVASLATAWGVIRFTSSTIESPFWSRGIALVLWVMAALNIVGWLAPAIALMDKAAIDLGEFKLSLLLVVKSLLAFAILFWAIGFLSGVLNRSFNKATSLTPSQRVLFFKLSNIFLYVIAIVVGLNIVGIDLTALTVFSGALGLGIGFGLQKVFSNLISGIILLLDKSVKPGDVIAIGNTYGWVNSLSARCVSVLTRDGKEHLIPNENLITQEVENWSYSDRRVRIHIPIHVSYRADVHVVKKLLLQAVEDHPRILKQPSPVCFITGFSEGAINHQIRAWIQDPQAGVSNVISDVYYRVWDLFQEHGIHVPVPQRDTHMKIDEDSPLVQAIVRALESRR